MNAKTFYQVKVDSFYNDNLDKNYIMYEIKNKSLISIENFNGICSTNKELLVGKIINILSTYIDEDVIEKESFDEDVFIEVRNNEFKLIKSWNMGKETFTYFKCTITCHQHKFFD